MYKNIKYSFFFDLDGTVTAQEILPEIAKTVGLYEQINELTQLTISGKIPFVESFLSRVEIFRNIKISDVKNVVENIKLNENIVSFIQENKESCFIITGNLDVWVSSLCDRIGCRYFTSKALLSEDGDYVKGVNYVLNKAHIANSFASPYVAIGDGNNDAEMVRFANIGIAYGGVHMPAVSVMDCASHAIFQEDKLCQFLKQLL
ncbi:HAD-IB family phosphatase [Ruminiclostridium cellobioparum]|uniref:HAD-IB family phosphatase n=1 Tax=Ruminiclostridium cellobioparum TaxID=29355 RepID=UPI000553A5A7|nr:HAD-IB family phosphatase [Ruminiclostridium cellobioparum]